MKRVSLVSFSLLVYLFIVGNMSSWAATLDSLLPPTLPKGWVLIEGPRLYTRKTLFERMDGQAVLYFKYGFQKSAFVMYQHQAKSGRQIELDIYDMGNVLQAFGIFSRFRSDERPGGIGLDSCTDGDSFLFYKDRYFVMLYAVESDPAALKELALAVSLRISDSSVPPKEIGFFPIKGLKPGSIQYFSEGLLGHQFLKRGFQGTYIEKDETKVEVEDKVEAKAERKADDGVKVEKKGEAEEEVKVGNQITGMVEAQSKTMVVVKNKADEEQKEFNLFLAIFRNMEDAKRALKTYRGYLTQKGKVESKTPPGFGPSALEGKDPYKGKLLITQKGSYLIGIIGFENEEKAMEQLGEMIQRIE